MNIIFRVDASTAMGIGHLMRCLTLAEVLRDRGADTRFLCRAHPDHLIEWLKRRALPVTVLPTATRTRPGTAVDCAGWLGVSQTQDAVQTIEALQGTRPDWLIVDHYGIDAQWEKLLRPHVSRLMVIDDLANRLHECTLLLDQTFVADGRSRYQNLVPDECRLLLGPRYALLRPEYAVARNLLPLRDGQVRRVLVFLGGSDSRHVTGRVLEALSAPEFQHLHVDVVVGRNNIHRSSLEAQAARRPLTTLLDSRSHLADLMAQADLAIGAGGATTWERFCLGLPAFVVSIAENQEPACRALSQAGMIYYAGNEAALDVQHLCTSLKRIFDDPQRLIGLSTAGWLLVDGLGVRRVIEMLHPTPVDQLRLRQAREDDVVLYFDWVNDPEVRRQSIKHEPILWPEHKAWFHRKLADPRSRLFVLEAGGVPVGQIRFDRERDEAHLAYSLDPLVRGRGWATPLVSMGIQWFQATEPIPLRADVKPGNEVSRAVFLKLGFEEQVRPGDGRMRVFWLPAPRIAGS